MNPSSIAEQLERFLGDDREGLLPCPFCGGEAEIGGPDNPAHEWWIYCNGCSSGPTRSTKERATTAWNTRAQDRALIFALLGVIKLQHETLEKYGDKRIYEGVGFWDGIQLPWVLADEGEDAREALRESAGIIEVMDKLKVTI